MILRFDEFELDPDAYELRAKGNPVSLEPKVFEILRYLVLHRDRVVTKNELLDSIWGDRFVSESTLSSGIKVARRAVGDDGSRQAKIKTKVSICVLDELWPFAYLQVYCDAVVDDDRDLVVAVMMAVGGRMSGEPLPGEARPVVAAMAEEEDRVVLRCRPCSTFAQPPRHLYENDQEEQITHWRSAVLPWDSTDEAGS